MSRAMHLLHYPPNASPREWGRAHGETFRAQIAELAAIRLALTVEVGRLGSEAEVLRAAQAHLDVLRAYDEPLYEELLGTAEGADVDPARIVVLNHYTDLRDLPPDWDLNPSLADAGCTVIYRRTAEGPILAQTWDIHGSAEPYVLMLHVPAHDGPDGPAPDAWVLSITGCLGMCGMNGHGVSIAINNVWSLDARVGLVWSALVRRVLRARTAAEARDLVLEAPLGSGHHYVVADATGAAFGIETSGLRRKLVFDGTGDAYIHTNHCFDAHIAEVTTVAPTSSTYRRLERMQASFASAPPDSVQAMWDAFDTTGAGARSVCLLRPNPDPTDPPDNTVATCAITLFDPARREVWAQQGAGPGTTPTRYALDAGAAP